MDKDESSTNCSPLIFRNLAIPEDQNVMKALNLVAKLTCAEDLDYDFMLDFFITFRLFMAPDLLMSLLSARLVGSLERIAEKRELLIFIRTFVTLRHWLLNHFQDDFLQSHTLRTAFCSLINDNSESCHKNYSDNDKSVIIKVLNDLKKTYLSLTSLYWGQPESITADVVSLPLKSDPSMDINRVSVMGLQRLRDPNYRRSSMLLLFAEKQPLAPLTSSQTNRKSAFLRPKDSLVGLDARKNEPEQFQLEQVDIFHDSSVTKVVPITPVKKMEVELKRQQAAAPLQQTDAAPQHSKMPFANLYQRWKKRAAAPSSAPPIRPPILKTPTPKPVDPEISVAGRYDLLEDGIIRDFTRTLEADDTSFFAESPTRKGNSFQTPSVTLDWSHSMDVEQHPEIVPSTVGVEGTSDLFSNESNEMFQRVSVKSYLTYDSELSQNVADSPIEEATLKKKTGFVDLRTEVNREQLLMDAFQELPFHVVEEREAKPRVQRNVDFPFNMRTSLGSLEGMRRVGPTELEQTKGEVETEKELEQQENEQFQEEDKVSMLNSQSFILPFPGLSANVIAELANIPDQSMDLNPIEYALMKLEGKVSQEKLKATQSHESSFNSSEMEKKVVDLGINSPSCSTPIRNGIQFTTPIKTPLESTLEEKLPSLSDLMKSKTHISVFLNHSSKTLATHLTLIEQKLLSAIDWKELIELKSSTELEPVASWLDVASSPKSGLTVVISRFNLMVNWIISEILLTTELREKKILISRLIHVAQHCKNMQNYNSVFQIILALTSEKVASLKETWAQLNPGEILIMKNVENITKPFKNFTILRSVMNSLDYQKGCIPFVGLHLNDLIFNSERPSILSEELRSDPVVKLEDDRLINVSKFRKTCQIVKTLLQQIDLSQRYQLEKEVDQDLLSKCLFIKTLTEGEMGICLQHAEGE